MKVDEFGVAFHTTNDLCDLLYEDPKIELTNVLVEDPEEFNHSVSLLYYDCEKLPKYIRRYYNDSHPFEEILGEFDLENQEDWYMTESYKKMDIAGWVLQQCKTDVELQRAGDELMKFQDRDLFPMLNFMKYFVDTMRKKNVVWGVGRGSSVASYVLFLIGVHKIDSIYYDLDINEFLK